MTTEFRLAELLEEHDMTQAALAAKSGVGLRTISRLVRNETGQVSLATLDRLAAVLGVEPGELIARSRRKR
jgi:transcriptional regulator with XRE-family HTH domain